MNVFVAAAIIGGSFFLIIAAVEYSKRRFDLSSEITRRIAHISAGLLALLAYLLLPVWLYVVAVSMIGVIFAFSQYKNVLTSVHSVKRHTYGELFLPLGLVAGLMASGFVATIYIPAILTLTFADSFGGLVSDIFKKQRKMIRGSIVFFLTCFVILLVYSDSTWYNAFLITLALTAIEHYSPYGSDNLTVPLATSLLLALF
jgi:dolichol kinase